MTVINEYIEGVMINNAGNQCHETPHWPQIQVYQGVSKMHQCINMSVRLDQRVKCVKYCIY